MNTGPSSHLQETLFRQREAENMGRVGMHNQLDCPRPANAMYYEMLASLEPKHAVPSSLNVAQPTSYPALPPKKRTLCESQEQADPAPKRTRADSISTEDSNVPVYAAEPPKVSAASTGVDCYAEHDILSGRGGATNVHAGNKFFRNLINAHRDQYLRARKNDKPNISRTIVSAIRRRQGRFLRKDKKTGLWFEIGDDLAREKTSQALRQRAPDYRRQMEEDDQRRTTEMSVPQAIPQASMISPLNTMSNSMGGGGPYNPPQPQDAALVLQYLAVKERQAELQYHMLMVNDLKQRLRMGLM